MVTMLLTFLVAILLGVTKSVPTKPSECEKRAHTSFSASQKQQLCATLGTTSIGPAVCASVAKNTLHFKFEDILELCQDSLTASPAQCMNQLDASMRGKYGVPLCKGAETALPAECYKELVSLKGNNDRVKPELAVNFCRNLEDRAPLLCIHAVSSATLLPINQALSICNDSVGSGSPSSQSFYNNVAAACILDMRHQVNPSLGLTAQDVVRFCVESNPSVYVDDEEELLRQQTSRDAGGQSAPAGCYLEAGKVKPAGGSADSSALLTTRLFSVKQRLELCRNAPVALGPVNCSVSAVENARDPTSKLKAGELAALCSGAKGTGPAECLLESKGLGSTEERIRLCNGAENSGPAKCYRRSAQSIKSDTLSRSLLCVSAVSDDPAVCLGAAPQYLHVKEKITLCAGADLGKGAHPVQCLQAVASASKHFANAPKKALGYFLDLVVAPAERTSRELMLNMCAFSQSMDPLASAECYKSVPNSLNHDDAVRMCTNVSSVEIIQHMQLCHRILPTQWESSEASTLCEGTTSRPQVEATVKCAVETAKFIFPQMTRLDAARLCESEVPSGAVLACAKEVARTPSSNPGAGYLITPAALVDTCSGARDSSRGACLSRLTTHSSNKFIFDAAVPARICRLPEPAAILSCLEGMHKRLVTVDDVDVCLSEKRTLKTMRVVRIATEDNDVEVTAGRRFSVWFDLFDQWGGRYVDAAQGVVFSASLNSNNLQGAVLWGLRTNYSQGGVLQLNSLVISQAGAVDLKISYREVSSKSDSDSGSGSSSLPAAGELQHLQVFRVSVKEDPSVVSAAPCVYLFKDAYCPADVPESVWISEFPRIRSYSPAKRYLQNLACASTVDVWHVDAWLGLDGSLWVEYRLGVDSIWTGIGMPRMEMSYAERLDLPNTFTTAPANATPSAGAQSVSESRARAARATSRKADRETQKALRRTYYRKSLQWHPDRWAGMPIYSTAVQGAFELINEAYNALAQQSGGSGGAEDATVL